MKTQNPSSSFVPFLTLLLWIGPLGAKPVEAKQFSRDRDFDLIHSKVDLNILMEQQSIEGFVELSMKPLQVNHTFINLDAADMVIKKVSSKDQALPFSHENQSLQVDLKSLGLNSLSPIEIKIEYRAKPKKGLYFFKKPLQVWSQGEAQNTRYWIPTYDFPNERASSEMTVRVPKQMTVISNGTLVSEKTSGEYKVVHYLQEIPHATYLTSLVVGELQTVKETSSKIPLWYVTPLKNESHVKHIFSNTPKMMSLLETWFKEPYPYTKYAQTVVHEFGFGGMENVSATTLNDYVLYPQNQSNDWQERTDSLIAHELVHQWFGDLITSDSWPHLWLNEGFATFYAIKVLGELYGKDSIDHAFLKDSQNIFRENNERATVSRNFDSPEAIFDSAVYARGSWILRMLEQQLGKENFLNAVQRYVSIYKHRNAETNDLRKIFQEFTAIDLSKFFDHWAEHAGWLELDVSHNYSLKTKQIEITLKQKAIRGSKDEYYSLPIEIWTLQNNTWSSQTVKLEGETTLIHNTHDTKPQAVLIDPRGQWLRKINQNIETKDLLTNETFLSWPFAKTQVVDQLKKDLSDENLSSLSRFLKTDPHPDIRAYSAKAIGESPNSIVFDLLLNALSLEKNSLVRTSIAQALQKDFRPSTLDKISTSLKSETSEQCKAAMLKHLTLAQNKTYWAQIEKGALTTSHRSAHAMAVLQALEETAWEEGMNLTQGFIQKDGPTHLKAQALKTLGAIAYYKKDTRPQEKIIAPFLQHENVRLQEAALSALANVSSDSAQKSMKDFVPSKDSAQLSAHKDACLGKISSRKNNGPKLIEVERKTQELEAEINMLKKQIAKP